MYTAPDYPQGVCGIRKAAELLTAVQTPAGVKKCEIVISDDKCVGNNTARSANVRAYGACAAAERTPLQKRKAVLSDSLSFLK